jgi:predicted ferric reductase
MLSLTSNFRINWNIQNNYIRFSLQGSLTGWAGIGFERSISNSPHTDMDTYVGWILSSGTAVLQDGYSTSMNIPVTDTTQSAKIISASQTSTFNLVFERLLDTKDSEDVAIVLGQPLKLTWAYHLENKPSSNSILAYYPQHTNDGSRIITISPPPTPSSLPPPTPSSLPPPTPSSLPPPTPSSLPPLPPTLSPSNTSIEYFLKGDDNFYVSWTTSESLIHFTYDCTLTGWVGIGFERSQSNSRIHQSTDTYISWILSSGQGIVQNGYSSTQTNPEIDDHQLATVTNASQINGRFQLSFQRPLIATSFTDYSFLPNEWVLMGWAYHSSANPNVAFNETTVNNLPIHTARGSVYKNIYTGETIQPVLKSLPSTYYLWTMFVLFICFSVFRRLKLNYHWLHSKSPYSNCSNAQFFNAIGIIVINILYTTIGVFNGFTQSEIWGYMSTANSMLVAIPATRNSVLSWISGAPVDQTIMYHRWLGRITIIQACVHFGCSVHLPNTFPYQNLFGTLALVSILTIGITSIKWLRRNAFNFFFGTHHLFIAYYILGSLHTPKFFTLTLLGICLYTLDLVIRLFRGLLPRKILYSEQVHHNLIKVRFPKPFICTSSSVGQYVFLNFPQVSIFEWHPFTLASSPNEPYFEVYIKNLGDYTRELIYYFSNTRNPIWIRVDGPYGKWPFDYTQYTHITFICGGVGITPCISFIRNVYGSSRSIGCLEDIYLVWCCTKETESEWIKHELSKIIDSETTEEQNTPRFHLYVFITDQKQLKNNTLHSGRPDIQSVFNLMEQQMTNETHKGCVFTCGPQSLTQETWNTWSTRKMNKKCVYHQEIFEF